jgi:Ca-activated chloride channel family protein
MVMARSFPRWSILLALLCWPAASHAQSGGAQPQPPKQDPFTFRTGVELINVTATVTDRTGRFVRGLTQGDFRVFDDDRPQPITHFSAERVPVSIGIVIDTSGSMDGEKIEAARDALDRFLTQLLDPGDEVFLYRFDNQPALVEGWTRDKRRISDAVRTIEPHGGTALYDAVADAVQMAQQGRNQKKAVLVISDGNDTSSRTDVVALRQLIRQTEVLVYAIGIDAGASDNRLPAALRPIALELQYPQQRPPRFPIPFPFPRPGGRRPPSSPPQPFPPTSPRVPRGAPDDDRVNAAALRSFTDDSGGRTEIVRFARDLDPATAGIADELSRQYYIGYAAPNGHDGRWHDIRVEVDNESYIVRARRGYVAAE